MIRRASLRALGLASVLVASLVACSFPEREATMVAGAGGDAPFGQGPAPTTVCAPGTTTACYDGPAGTLGLGICRDGVKTCKDDGTGFGACEGQVLPKPKEDCETSADDNCNGQTDDGCGCVPGTMKDCYEGPGGTKDVGVCKGGQKACNADGAGYGPCVGQVLPGAEDCATPIDEDCDGNAGCTAGDTLTAKTFGGPGDDAALAVVVDKDDAVVVAGHFHGTIDFGGGPLTSAGGDDVFIAKFLANGVFSWAKRFGDAADQRATAVAVDASGRVFVGGVFDGTLDVGKGSATSAGGGDGFVAGLDKSGNPLWVRGFGDGAAQEVTGVGADPFGDVTVVGRFEGSANFGAGDVASKGAGDAFVAQYDTDGGYVWTKTFGDASDQAALGMAVDANANVWVTGSAAGSVDFGGGALAAKGTDVFLAKLDPNGGHLASHLFGGAEAQAGVAVAVDTSGNAVVGGYTLGPIDLGAGAMACGAGAGVFLARFASNGATMTAGCYGMPVPAVRAPLGVAADPAGGVYVAGPVWGAVDFGGGALTSFGGTDAYFLHLDGTLKPLGSRRFGDAADQAGRGVSGDSKGNAWMAGSFAGTIEIGKQPSPSAGGDDAFLAKISP